MRPKKYPLDPLVRLRHGKVETSVKALASAIRAREEAERVRLEAEALRARLAEEARQLRDAEDRALARGELSVADLQRLGAWQARTRWEDDARAEQVAAAEESVERARAGEGTAQSEVRTAEAEAKVVKKHRSRWASEAERAAEAAAEEGATEAWRPRR